MSLREDIGLASLGCGWPSSAIHSALPPPLLVVRDRSTRTIDGLHAVEVKQCAVVGQSVVAGIWMGSSP